MLIIISAVTLVLSMVVLLTAGEKHGSYLERMSQGYDLRGVETCSIASRSLEHPSTSRSDPDEIAKTITINAQRCLEYIDDMKEEYVSIYYSTGTLHMDILLFSKAL